MTRSREFLLKLFFLLVAVTLTLAAAEIALRVISSRTLIYNIEMVKYAKALKQPDPCGEVSHIHVPNKSARLMGVEIALNSLGNRSPELLPEKKPGEKRLLVLGSSITMGWGVPAKKVFTSILEKKLNEEKPFGDGVTFAIQNAGIGNYNTVFQSILFEREYPTVRPDLVVLQYFISDVQPRTMGRNNWLLKHSFLADYLVDRIGNIEFKTNRSRKDLFSFYADFYKDDSGAWKVTQERLVQMRDKAAADQVPLIVMIIPDIHDLSPGTPYRSLYSKMEQTFLGRGLTTINTFGAFQSKFGNDVSKLWIQSDDPHPNADGHALMADELYRYFTKADPLKLKSGAPATN